MRVMCAPSGALRQGHHEAAQESRRVVGRARWCLQASPVACLSLSRQPSALICCVTTVIGSQPCWGKAAAAERAPQLQTTSPAHGRAPAGGSHSAVAQQRLHCAHRSPSTESNPHPALSQPGLLGMNHAPFWLSMQDPTCGQPLTVPRGPETSCTQEESVPCCPIIFNHGLPLNQTARYESQTLTNPGT